MLYPKSQTTSMDPQVFTEPGPEYRGAPFWAWNTKLDQTMLIKQIHYFKEMGMGGFHIHVRIGLDTPYLGPTFMADVKAVAQEAKQEHLLTYLYDEDRWPSGYGGGKVTQDPAFRSRYLVLTPVANEDRLLHDDFFISSAEVVSNGHGKLLARYAVTLEDGALASYRRLADDESSTDCWYLYLEVAEPSPWFNNQTYVDTLNKAATQKFIETTHEAYAKVLGDEFGAAVPSIFTDEPQFAHETTLESATDQHPVILPFTEQFLTLYADKYGADFLDTIPELIWERADQQPSVARFRYHDEVAELFASAYADTLGDWTQAHGLALTGHVMDEPTLDSQTHSTGEAMRSYRALQVPGIDMLVDSREYTTAKQAQSAAHQYGREGTMSEEYGVTNWDFDFRGHKLQGDWQAALGVTLRVLHLAWASMAGEAKRDYPASIFYQSPWYQEYRMVEDHFARVNTALTRGKPVVKIGVLHPIDTYWLHYGPLDQTAMIRQELERHFEDVTQWLLFGQLDFDYISEGLLTKQWRQGDDARLHVGEMAYDVVVVPGCETLRHTTLDALEQFKAQGGQVIIMGNDPYLQDAAPSTAVKTFAAGCAHIPFAQTALLKALASVRTIEIRRADGTLASDYLYQMRHEADGDWVFIANGKPTPNRDVPRGETVTIALPGAVAVTRYDTLSGAITPLKTTYDGKMTRITWRLYDQDSLLLKVTRQAASGSDLVALKTVHYAARTDLVETVPVTLAEPNVCVLDMAASRFDDQPWQPAEEILRIDNRLRAQLGWPLRMEAFAQPWVDQTPEPVAHHLTLKFTVHSQVHVAQPQLALEEASSAQIRINGQSIDTQLSGYYVDEAIQRVTLPDLEAGTTEIVVTMPYTHKTNVEAMYLLGDFGVQVAGAQATLTDPVKSLAFSDYGPQGLAFYGGNITYHLSIEVDAGTYDLQISKFRAPVLKVAVDGVEVGNIAFAPYTVTLGQLTAGPHEIAITVYGNRFNTFGTIHNCDDNEHGAGPNSWRTTDERFAYEYQLKPVGILKAPVLLKRVTE